MSTRFLASGTGSNAGSCKACFWKYMWHLLELLTLVLPNLCWEPLGWLHLLVRGYLILRSKACHPDLWVCPVTGQCCRGLRDLYLVPSGLVSGSVWSGVCGRSLHRPDTGGGGPSWGGGTVVLGGCSSALWGLFMFFPCASILDQQRLLGSSCLLHAKEQMLQKMMNSTAQAPLGADLVPSYLTAIE